MIVTSQIGAAAQGPDVDEVLSARLRDLALVELDVLAAGNQALVGSYADDVIDALREARARIGELRAALAGPDPLNVLEATPRQRASDAGHAGAARTRDRRGAGHEAVRGRTPTVKNAPKVRMVAIVES
jgi:hypothetical protein